MGASPPATRPYPPTPGAGTVWETPGHGMPWQRLSAGVAACTDPSPTSGLFSLTLCYCVSLRRTGIQYLKGGVASGFRHVSDDDYEPALFQVKGRRNVRVTQVGAAEGGLMSGRFAAADTGGPVSIDYTSQLSHARHMGHGSCRCLFVLT